MDIDGDDRTPESDEVEVPEAPATWENVAVGKAKQALGRVIGDEELAEDGADQEEIARDVRAEFRREHED
jgi:uncharacterized protein YjbJ (UPF0337 family)